MHCPGQDESSAPGLVPHLQVFSCIQQFCTCHSLFTRVCLPSRMLALKHPAAAMQRGSERENSLLLITEYRSPTI